MTAKVDELLNIFKWTSIQNNWFMRSYINAHHLGLGDVYVEAYFIGKVDCQSSLVGGHA